jgi:hypothetical protein
MRLLKAIRIPVLMLVDSRQLLKAVVVCGLFGLSGGVTAGDDELPDVEFLEYLGSWDESDEDWLLVSDMDRVRKELAKDERSDSGQQVEDSTETENEG